MASKIKLKNNIDSEFTVTHEDNQGAISVLSTDLAKLREVDTIEALRALEVGSGTIWVSGYHTKGDGAFGSNIFEWDATSTEADNGGTIIKLASVATGRYKLRYSGAVNVKWFGEDINLAIASIIENGIVITCTNNHIYNINARIESLYEFTLDMCGAKITSTTIDSLIDIRNNISINNGSFETSFVSALESNGGIIQCIGYNVDTIKLNNVKFYGNSTTKINAVKFDATTSIIKNIFIDNMECYNIGRMGIEAICHTNGDSSLYYIELIKLNNIYTNNTGTTSIYGMGVSISGNVITTIMDTILIDSFKNIGIENAGGRYFYVDNFIIKNPKDTNTKFVSIYDSSDLYISNMNTVLTKGVILGNAKIVFKSIYNKIILNNIFISGIIPIRISNVEFTDSTIKTNEVIETEVSSTNSFINCNIELSADINAKFYIALGVLYIQGGRLKKSSAGKLVDLAGTATCNIDNVALDGGYITGLSTNIVNITDLTWVNVGTYTGMDGACIYRVKNMYSNNVYRDGLSEVYNADRKLQLGLYRFWVDAAGKLRIKYGAPSSDLDGTVVGTQT